MEKDQSGGETVHHVLAKSYLIQFFASLIGLLVDSVVTIPIAIPFAMPVAIMLLCVGPILMLWAQYTSWRCAAHDHSAAYFHHGPYRFVRNPTHLGILILVAGYALIAQSFVFFFTTLIGFIVSNRFFARYERLNETSYGQHYQAYKSRTPKL